MASAVSRELPLGLPLIALSVRPLPGADGRPQGVMYWLEKSTPSTIHSAPAELNSSRDGSLQNWLHSQRGSRRVTADPFKPY